MEQPGLYILTAPPRVGKTKLSVMFRDRYPWVELLSCDARRAKLWKDFEGHEKDYLDLFQMIIDNRIYTADADWFREVADKPDYVENRQRKMHKFVWYEKVKDEITEAMQSGRSVLVEGVAAYPHLVAQLPYSFHYVVMGTKFGQAEHMRRHASLATTSKEDWMYGWSDAKIERYAQLQAEMSSRLETEAKQFGFPYVEMSDGNYNLKQTEVLDSLVSSATLFHGPVRPL